MASPRSGAFADFYLVEHRALLRFLVKARSASYDDAWDVVQEVFASAYERWETIDTPRTWLRTSALRAYDKQKKRPVTDADRAVRGGWVAGAYFDPQVELKEETQVVYRAIATLPDRQREVMAWTYDGYKPAEIAAILTRMPGDRRMVTAETVRANLHQARRKLKDLLSSEGGVG